MGEFKMPSLGADMDAGTLVEWKVKPGDRVHKGDLVATVETVKGAIEIEIFEDGVIEELLVQPGATVPVNTVLARLGPDGAVPASPQPPHLHPPPEPPVLPRPSARTAVPSAPAAAPTAPALPEEVPPGPAPAPPPHRLHASPVARRLAQEQGIDLSTLAGSGPQGSILRADVEAALRARVPSPPPPAPAPPPRAGAFDAGAMRGAISAAMSRSKREIPHYYLSTEVDLHAALGWLERYNQDRPAAARLLPAALLLKATALAVAEVPEVNGHYEGGVFRPSAAVHLGVAIHLRAGGLIAPALRDAQAAPLAELMARLSDLVERARRGGLKSSELAPPTLTVTNLGDQGVTAVFPIIHPPQVAMVGFGKVVERPWVVEGMLGPRPLVVASLAADHRVSDGHRGARFLAALDRLLQSPEAL